MYYPQFADITASTDLTFFPMTRLLELFCYLEYVDYDRAVPVPRWLDEYNALYTQLVGKYSARHPMPVKDPDYYRDISVSME